MRDSWRLFLGWDGILPLGVAVIPALVKLLFPRNDLAEVGTFLLVPMGAALVRSVVGAKQIRRVCDGALPLMRQLLLAQAIVMLLLFEGMVCALVFAADEPALAWIYAVIPYLAYLATISFVFVPSRKKVGE